MLLQVKGSRTIVPPKTDRIVVFGDGYIRFRPSSATHLALGVIVWHLTPTFHLRDTGSMSPQGISRNQWRNPEGEASSTRQTLGHSVNAAIRIRFRTV